MIVLIRCEIAPTIFRVSRNDSSRIASKRSSMAFATARTSPQFQQLDAGRIDVSLVRNSEVPPEVPREVVLQPSRSADSGMLVPHRTRYSFNVGERVEVVAGAGAGAGQQLAGDSGPSFRRSRL